MVESSPNSRDGTSSATTSGRDGTSSESTENCKMSSSQDSQLHRLFEDLDTDHSGKIEPEELRETLQKLGLPHNSDRYLRALMQQFDLDHDNKIDFEDFKAYACRKEDVIAKSFAQLDMDHNGSISVDDLEAALKARWLPLDQEDASRMVHLLDRDQNGMVSYEEFRTFAYLLPESQVNETEILQSWVDSADWMEGIEYHVASVPPKTGFSRFVAGGIAGGFSKSVIAPVERLRIMMMADSRNKSFHKTAAKMWRDGGLPGMFRGNLTTVLKVLPQTATQFAVYDTIQESMIGKLKDNNLAATSSDLSALQHAFAGGLAGAVATAVTYPIETVRTQMCVCSKKGLWDIMTEIGYASGTRGYFRGVKSSIANAAVSNALGFAAYESAVSRYKKWSGNHSPTPTIKGVCAGVSACGVMALVMPLENVQRRLQVQGRDGYPVIYSGSRDCVKRMYQAEGIRAFWRGSITSFLKVAPSLAAVRFAYEIAMRSQLAGGIHQYRDEKPPRQQAPVPTF